eukprot:9467437-Pyramimonas_sp.AAC.1
MALAPPPPKRIRAVDFGRTSYVSASALSNILRMVEEMDLPENYSCSKIARERQELAYQKTSFGPLNQRIMIDKVECWVQHPFGFLEAASARSAEFRNQLISTLDRCSDTKSLIVYTDEVVPGNPLSSTNQRKIWVVYWSIKEYGFPTLASEYCWYTACVMRTSMVSDLPGKMSQMIRG